jgi:TRAP-type C4-dicarboxylate transport system substrate-binding protein
MNIAETFSAMQQNVVEGIEGAIPDMAALSIQEVAKTAVMTAHVLSPKAFLAYGPFIDSLTPKSKEAFIRAATEASDFYGETTKAQETELIAAFKAKGINFVEPGHSIEEMAAMEEPLKKQLPEVWTWTQKLLAK